MNKKILLLAFFNFLSLCVGFFILPLNYKAFNFSSSTEAKQLIANSSFAEALFKAEQFGYKTAINGYKNFIALTIVVLIINIIALSFLYKKMKQQA